MVRLTANNAFARGLWALQITTLVLIVRFAVFARNRWNTLYVGIKIAMVVLIHSFRFITVCSQIIFSYSTKTQNKHPLTTPPLAIQHLLNTARHETLRKTIIYLPPCCAVLNTLCGYAPQKYKLGRWRWLTRLSRPKLCTYPNVCSLIGFRVNGPATPYIVEQLLSNCSENILPPPLC